VLPEKTRIAFQVRMSFAQVAPRARWLDGHVVLARRLEDPRFRRIETVSPATTCITFGGSPWRTWTRAWLRRWAKPTPSGSSGTWVAVRKESRLASRAPARTR